MLFFALPLNYHNLIYPFFSYTLPSLPSNLSYRILVKIVDGGLHTNIPQRSGSQPLVCQSFQDRFITCSKIYPLYLRPLWVS